MRVIAGTRRYRPLPLMPHCRIATRSTVHTVSRHDRWFAWWRWRETWGEFGWRLIPIGEHDNWLILRVLLWATMIDTVGIVHAIVLRIQALLLPVKTLVFSGGH